MKRALEPVAILVVSVSALIGACGGGAGNDGAAGNGGAPGGTTGSAGHAGGTTGSAGAAAGSAGSAVAGATGTAGTAGGTTGNAGAAAGSAGNAVAGTTGSAGAVAGATGSAGSAAAGTTGSAGAIAGATGSAGAVGGAAGSAGAIGGGGRGGAIMCSTLEVTGDFVTPTQASGTPPVPAGGAFGLGTYVLTKTEVYPPATIADAPTMKHTLRFTTTATQYEHLQTASQISGSAQVNTNYDISGLGKSLKLIKVCGSGYEVVVPYTASGDTLMMVFGDQTKEYRTYTKR